VLFVTESENEAEVRRRIGRALAGGSQVGPDGHETTWALRGSAPGTPREAEREHGRRMDRD